MRASPMIVSNAEPSLTQLALVQALRPTAAAGASASTASPALPTPPAAAPTDDLAILQQSADPPEVRLPSRDLARRYAESGTLTPRSEPAAAAVASAVSAADDRLLSDLSQAYRPMTPAEPRTIATVAPHVVQQSATMTLIVDGRAVILSPAQAIAVRAAVGTSLRRLGPGAGSSDSEDPTTVLARASREAEPARIVQSLTPAGGPPVSGSQHQEPRREHAGTNRNGLSETGEAVPVPAVRASHGHPVPYEPAVIVPPLTDPVPVGPGPDAPWLAGPTTPVVSGLAIAFAPGVSAQDVVAHSTPGMVSLTANGSEVLAVAASEAVVAQLVFADGTTTFLRLGS